MRRRTNAPFFVCFTVPAIEDVRGPESLTVRELASGEHPHADVDDGVVDAPDRDERESIRAA
jgi:hypothetical protein